MAAARDHRRCAIQVLYQFDACGDACEQTARESLVESSGGEEAHQQGFDLACEAWKRHTEADAAVAGVSDDWPTHRQPVVDRSILRLAWYEIFTGLTPPKIAINEAVELAKEFSTDKSPLFINGVLDKLYKSHRDETPGERADETEEAAPVPSETIDPSACGA